MKRITFWGIVGFAFVSLAQPTWAGRGGGGGFGGGGHIGVGGFAGGGSRAAPAFYGGGFRGAPAFRGSYFSGGSVGRAAPRFYYGGPRMSGVRPNGFAHSVNRPISPSAGRIAPANRQPDRLGPNVTAARRQPDRMGSMAGRNRVSDPRVSNARNREFVRDHASERHNANNWHRDWDRHHAHFNHNRVFVFVDGFWWGLDPWDYPYYGYGDPYDYGDYPSGYSSYPYDYDYSGNPCGYYNYYPNSDDDQPGYAGSGQSTANATVSAVQLELSKLGYYNGAVDGDLGDQTEAALARYQQDRDFSVSGTVDAPTLRSLGIKR